MHFQLKQLKCRFRNGLKAGSILLVALFILTACKHLPGPPETVRFPKLPAVKMPKVPKVKMPSMPSIRLPGVPFFNSKQEKFTKVMEENVPTENNLPITFTNKRLKEIVQKQEALFEKYGSGNKEELEQLELRIQQIIAEYDALIAESPHELMPYIFYGKLLRKIGHADRAHVMFVRANYIDPNIAVVKQQLANYLAEEGKFQESLGFYLQAIELASEIALYHYQLGDLLHTYHEDFISEGGFDRITLDEQMISAFNEAVRLEPDNIEFRMRQAETFYDIETPNWEQALYLWTQLEKDSRPGIERSAIRLHRANVLAEMGRFQEARAIVDSVNDPLLDYSKQKVLKKLQSRRDDLFLIRPQRTRR